MISPFGVDHGYVVSKRTAKADRRVPDWATSALPASSVKAYDNSSRHKVGAATSNLAAKTTGGAVGGLLGMGAMTLAAKKIPALKRASKIAGMTISADRKAGYAAAAAGGVVGGGAGGIMGNRSLNRIKGDKKYGYRERE